MGGGEGAGLERKKAILDKTLGKNSDILGHTLSKKVYMSPLLSPIPMLIMWSVKTTVQAFGRFLTNIGLEEGGKVWRS